MTTFVAAIWALTMTSLFQLDKRLCPSAALLEQNNVALEGGGGEVQNPGGLRAAGQTVLWTPPAQDLEVAEVD